MNILFTLACLVACLLIAINQIRITRRIEEDIVTAINQCSRDLSQVEAVLGWDPRVEYVEDKR